MSPKVALKKPLLDYFKMFYADYCFERVRAGLMCGYALLGPGHLLSPDMPFDAESGDRVLRNTIASIERNGHR